MSRKNDSLSQKFLKNILEGMPDAIVACHANGEIVYANHQANILFGYANHELLTVNVNKILPEKSILNDTIPKEEYFSNPNTLSMIRVVRDYVGRKKGGEEFICDISMNGIETANGRVLIRAIKDITEKKKMEQQLIESEAMFKGILSSTLNHIAVMNSKGVIIEANEAWKKAAKDNEALTIERVVIGQNRMDHLAAKAKAGNEYAKQAYDGINAVLEKKQRYFEMQYPYYKDSDECWYLLRVMTFVNDDTKVVLAHSDIIKLKKQIKESELKYKTIVDMTKEMITTISPEGQILFANKSFYENLHYSEEELKKLKLADVLTPETKIGHKERIERLRKGEIIEHFNGVMKTKNNDHVTIEGTVIPLIRDGKHIGTQGFIRNITERKKLEWQLENTLLQVKHIFNTLDIAFWGADIANNKMLYVSPGNKNIYGYADEYFLNNPNFWFEVIIDEDKHKIDAISPELSEGLNVVISYRIKHADSSIRWLEARMTPTLDSAGNMIRLDGIAIDITEHRNA